MKNSCLSVIAVIAFAISACTPASPTCDVIIRGGTVYNGLGGASLNEDGRGMSDPKQGVTLEVMGEGWSQ
jgi:hypothetical protein